MNVSVVELAKKTWQEFGKDEVGRLGAALAYYTFTSFFPLLLVLISLVGIALSLGFESAEDARTTVMNAVSANLPAARDLLAQSFNDTEQNAGTLGLVGLLTGLWAASGVFAQLDQAFSIIYDISPRKKSIIDTLKSRAQAGLIVIAIAALMIGSLIFGTVLQTAESFVQSLPGGGVLGFVLNLALSLVLTAGVFAVLFKFLPDKPVTWKAALIGGVFASVTWQIGRELLTWWLGRADGATAGTVVGSVLAFLALVYYASQIIMLGAELTATYDEMANPDLVRHKTSEDSPLRGPGQPAVNEGGEQIPGTGGGKGGSFTEGRKGRSESASNTRSGATASKGSNAAVATEDGEGRITTFGTGFVGGILASLITGRVVVNKVVDRIRGRE